MKKKFGHPPPDGKKFKAYKDLPMQQEIKINTKVWGENLTLIVKLLNNVCVILTEKGFCRREVIMQPRSG